MNVHPSHPLPPQDQPLLPLRAPPGFSLGPRLHHGPMVGLHRLAKPQRDLSAEEQQELRRKINSRERKRMQDLNVAMDALREVMVPYAASPASAQTPGRRLSKISTLVLARNYILLLGSSLQEMRRLLGEVSGMGVSAVSGMGVSAVSGMGVSAMSGMGVSAMSGMGVSTAPVPRLLVAGGWPVVSNPTQILLTQESFVTPPSASSSGKCPAPPTGAVEAMLVPGQWGNMGAAGGGLCPCGVCRLPRFSHSTTPTRFTK